jgi:DNA polymerase-3 subunit alpha
MTSSSFAHLHVHSQYSILDSTASVQALAERAKSFGMQALALTDKGNLHGVVDFFKACKGAGIKPIIGCELWMAPGARQDKKRIPGQSLGASIVLLAKDTEGYRNLCKLSSSAFLEGFYYQPRIDKELLSLHRGGLICLTREEVPEEILFYRELFGEDLYFELTRHKMSEEQIEQDGVSQESWLLQKLRERTKEQERVNAALILRSQELSVKTVATNEIHYIERDDWRAHEILLNIQSGEPCEIWERDSRGVPKNRVPNPKREALFTHELYFKSAQDMSALFADQIEAVDETREIVKKCNLELDFKTKHYPVFVPPHLEGKSYTKEERIVETEETLRNLCLEGIEKRYTKERLAEVHKTVPGKDPNQVVRDRFEYEFGVLTSKGMCDYTLIVYDFINWAKRQGIPMGPGRGSAAGSIIAYLIGITDIEPLRFHLFFERFINPERASYPDIDVDICMARRQEVIDYTIRKYGKEKVAQIITFGTMKAKMAIRDVGRVLNVPLSKVNEIAKLVPEDPNMTLEKAFQLDPELSSLMASDEEAKRLLEMAKRCEGSIRNTSTHAAGLIISANPITDHIPVCMAKDSDMTVTQFAMKPVEMVGMLKIDVLGLKTLTSIQKCVEMIRANEGPSIDWCNLPLDDVPTYQLFHSARTLGLFQIESGGMQDLVKQLHIDVFEEIIAVGSLYRPGPMDMIPSFINRKHGREAIEIDHPLMKDILSETYGLMVYQEQVMQIASLLAGYSLGEGDMLRRAMGKKDKEEMERQREKFIAGCGQKAIDVKTAEVIFNKIEKFASYGFNKSHAAAYAYLTYVTAYFKANYPREWMAALMTCDRDDLTKVAKFIREALSMQIPILSPDINESGLEFAARPSGIRFAMTGIKGVGLGIVELILEERKRGGAFESLYEFVKRIDKSKVGKKQIELLIEAGCFDAMGWSRDAMREGLDAMYDDAARGQKEEKSGVMNLFSLLDEPKTLFLAPPPVLKPSSKMQLFQREKELLGFYLTGHPMDNYQGELALLSCNSFKEFDEMEDKAIARAAFLIETVQVKVSAKSQRKFAILTISDGFERFELPVWPDLYEEKGALLKENQPLYGLLQLEREEGSLRLQTRYLDDLTAVDEGKIKAFNDAYDRFKGFSGKPKSSARAAGAAPKEEAPLVRLRVHADSFKMSQVLLLKKVFREHAGKSRVEIQFETGEPGSEGKRVGTLSIESSWGVKKDSLFEKKLLLIHGITLTE